MNSHTINKIMQSGPIDFDAPNAVMKLAWIRLAQTYWSARYFDAPINELRADLAEQLKQAWRDVRRDRTRRAQRARAEASHGTELMGLRQMERDLENKPLGVVIAPMQKEIQAKIAAIIAAS